MKSELKNYPPIKEEQKYPYLGICPDGTVVLFSGPKTGVVIYIQNPESKYNYIGEYSSEWFELSFEPLCGKVTLSND